ncbi:hypothetical protein BLNAU_6650 [Blattamonas nauphoetae]|uniref:Uncharacterized protein n=1 Tax=Blattamonas nauphoetae TaxID=2049346 RepID=A0ABQ9Y3R7_9EUKA|nr:hypothetical protein BLNAU_6650 [Blattamonas nauphoetae]
MQCRQKYKQKLNTTQDTVKIIHDDEDSLETNDSDHYDLTIVENGPTRKDGTHERAARTAAERARHLYPEWIERWECEDHCTESAIGTTPWFTFRRFLPPYGIRKHQLQEYIAAFAGRRLLNIPFEQFVANVLTYDPPPEEEEEEIEEIIKEDVQVLFESEEEPEDSLDVDDG